MRRQAGTSALLGIALALISGCTQRGTLPPQSQLPSLAQAIASSGHLYVTQPGSGSVLRFPLSGTRGIPAQRPDAVIRGLSQPRGVAIAPDGSIYVVDAGTQTLLIYRSAVGMNATPVRRIALGHGLGLGSVAVDGNGNAYVAWSDARCTTDGFECGYADVYSPSLVKTKTLAFGGGPPSGIVRSLATTGRHVLAVNLGGQGITVLQNPGHGQSYPIFCGAGNGYSVSWGPGGALFQTDLGSSPPSVAVIRSYRHGAVNNCPSHYAIEPQGFRLVDPRAMSARGNVVYVASAFDRAAGSARIVLLDTTRAGLQAPIAVVEGSASQLHDIGAMAIGP